MHRWAKGAGVGALWAAGWLGCQQSGSTGEMTAPSDAGTGDTGIMTSQDGASGSASSSSASTGSGTSSGSTGDGSTGGTSSGPADSSSLPTCVYSTDATTTFGNCKFAP